MPLEIYIRGRVYWVKGRIEYDGRPITRYYRQSTGALTEQGATDRCAAERDRQIRRNLFGEEAPRLTFADAVVLYDPKPKDVPFLVKLLESLGNRPIEQITGKEVRDLGPVLYPDASTDTWQRQVVTPARAVINNAHELGKAPMIRIRAYSEMERIRQDEKRGKQSRVERTPSTRDWVDSFCGAADPYNAALVRFMFETGARIDQAVSLKPSDLELMNLRVWLKSAKGHAAQWVTISQEMVVELANLSPKRPQNRRTGETLPPRVFGYASRTGYRKAWATICKAAGIEYLGAHEATATCRRHRARGS